METRKKYLILRVIVHITLLLAFASVISTIKCYENVLGKDSRYYLMLGSLITSGYALVNHVISEIVHQRFFHVTGFGIQTLVILINIYTQMSYKDISWSSEFIFIWVLISFVLLLNCTRFKVSKSYFGGIMGPLPAPKGYILHHGFWHDIPLYPMSTSPSGYYKDYWSSSNSSIFPDEKINTEDEKED